MIRVAITTDRFDAAAPAYAASGLQPVHAQCIRVESADEATLDEARKSALESDLLVLTSARSVDFLWPSYPMPSMPVAAVGKRTASAVRARGGHVVAVGTSGLEELAMSIGPRLRGSRVAYPHAIDSVPEALAAVRELCPDLQESEIYRTVPIAPSPTPADAVVFASPTAVDGWLLTRGLDGLLVAAIGPTTAAALAPLRSPDVVSPEPSHHALARALTQYMEVPV